MSTHFQILRKEPAFRRLVTAGLISGIGDWFNTVAVMHLLEKMTGGAMAVGITMALKVAPFVLFGTLGGYLADRFCKKSILIVTDLASAFFAAAFLFASSSDRVWVIYLATLGLVLSSICNAPARTASVRLLVQPDHLLAASSLNQMMGGSVMVLGAAIGGVVAAALGAQITFVINAVSFLVSALL
ncbi:MAG: MFS transporter, partial [Tumebacillaceae bacterium]